VRVVLYAGADTVLALHLFVHVFAQQHVDVTLLDWCLRALGFLGTFFAQGLAH
jgi:hypothetical protein